MITQDRLRKPLALVGLTGRYRRQGVARLPTRSDELSTLELSSDLAAVGPAPGDEGDHTYEDWWKPIGAVVSGEAVTWSPRSSGMVQARQRVAGATSPNSLPHAR